MALCLASCQKNNGTELSGDDIIQFEDPNFLKALLCVQEIVHYNPEGNECILDYLMDVDRNKDGQISVNEAQDVLGLSLLDHETEEYFNIRSMPEIKYFTSLIYLGCDYNQLTSLDVSNCTELISLHCDDNQLTKLDLSNNTALAYLDNGNNQLTSLDVSNCTELIYLSCEDNQLTTLDLSNNAALTELVCHDNQLTSLDVSNCTELISLICYDNQLTTLDLSNNTALTYLMCYGNSLSKIILPKNHNLSEFIIEEILLDYGDIIEYVE